MECDSGEVKATFFEVVTIRKQIRYLYLIYLVVVLVPEL